MTEKQYENALLALGCQNVTTQSQLGNGTTAFQLPTGQVVSEHVTGYIRRNIYREPGRAGGRCYQLNPTYEPVKKLYLKFKEYISEGERLLVNIPFPEINRRIKGVLAINKRKDVNIALMNEKF